MFDSLKGRKLILPSLLAADAANLQRDIDEARAGGADALHLDIMDGHFVPNLSYGPHVCACVAKATDLKLDVHLMVSHPRGFLKPFAGAGAYSLTIHAETDAEELPGLLREIHGLGCFTGLSVKPQTPEKAVLPYLSETDMVLLMTVEPGFGGQGFLPASYERIAALRALLDREKPECLLEIDGGVGPGNIARCAALGANVFVAGSSAFGGADTRAKVQRLRLLANT